MSKQVLGQQVLYFPLTRILTSISALAAGYAAAQYWPGEMFKPTSLDKEAGDLLTSILSALLLILIYVFLFRPC